MRRCWSRYATSCSAAAALSAARRAPAIARPRRLYNSAYLFTTDGARPVYDKRHLLPFVERQPLRPEDGPYLRGGDALPVATDGARVGVLICYEVIDPALARAAVDAGANLLLNLSNDSWFAAGAGPAQHYAIARFRAVENRVALLRATNSGVSGAFDPNGRELARLPADVAVAELVSVRSTPAAPSTHAARRLVRGPVHRVDGNRSHNPRNPWLSYSSPYFSIL